MQTETKYLTAPQVLERYSITDMCLHRWMEKGFPGPVMRVNNRRYWLESELVAWEKAHVPKGKTPRPGRNSRAAA